MGRRSGRVNWEYLIWLGIPSMDANGNEIVKCEFTANSEEEKKTFISKVKQYLNDSKLLIGTIGGGIAIEY